MILIILFLFFACIEHSVVKLQELLLMVLMATELFQKYQCYRQIYHVFAIIILQTILSIRHKRRRKSASYKSHETEKGFLL